MRKISGVRMLAVGLGMVAVAPAMAQQVGVPLLRVYVEDPYFYDIVADVSEPNGQQWSVRLYAEGKEVGESEIVYDCVEGIYDEVVTTEWTGGSPHFVAPALVAFDHLYCGV